MRIVSYNIQYGCGKDGCNNIQRIIESIANADLIALQEVDRYFPRSDNIDQVTAISELLPDFHWVFGPGVDLDADLYDEFGHPLHRRRQFGNMLLSRRPILSSRNHLLPKSGTLRGVSLQRSALEALIDTAIGPLRFYSVHLTHLAATIRRMEIKALLSIHKRIAEEGSILDGAAEKLQDWIADTPPPFSREAVLLGDFNLTSQEAEYELLVGPASPRYGRLGLSGGFADAWVAVGNAEDGGVTSDFGERIDYGFVSIGLASRIRKVWIDQQAQGSDHQPLWLELDL